jgi:hypothetical protein
MALLDDLPNTALDVLAHAAEIALYFMCGGAIRSLLLIDPPELPPLQASPVRFDSVAASETGRASKRTSTPSHLLPIEVPKLVKPVILPPARKTGDKASLNWIGQLGENDRNCICQPAKLG